jgi:hypothetical protein
VAWVWVLVAGIGVGLPAVAWWLSRGARSVPLSVPGRRADPIDRWLFDRYGLGVLDRWQVREALTQGRRPGQPLLGEAADGLAAEVLSGRLHGPRAWRWLGWCFVSYGICFCIAGIVGHGLIGRVAYFLGGASMALVGIMYLVLMPRQLRRKARLALQEPRTHL